MFEYFFRRKRTIVHCCTEKTASQWFKAFLSDPIILVSEKLRHVEYNRVYHDQIVNNEDSGEFYRFSRKLYYDFDPLGFHFNNGELGTTFYMAYPTVKKTIPKNVDYKIFFILRDPRDLLISAYYSMKNSHPLINKTAEQERRILSSMDIQEGIRYMTDSVNSKTRLFDAQLGWVNGALDPLRERVFRYEDLASNYSVFVDQLMTFLNLHLSKEDRNLLIEKYSFEKFSGGRDRGLEDKASHYRKATSNQWVDVLNDETKEYFKNRTGDLIDKLGYTW